nr:hypothetical protein CFP56_26606 [Quercus suber]
MPGTKRWDEELIDRNFYPWEAAVIKGNLVSQVVEVDTLVSPLMSDGTYSVQSAYRLYAEFSQQALPSSSNAEGGKGLWNGIWKLRVPPKAIWRFDQCFSFMLSEHFSSFADAFLFLCKEASPRCACEMLKEFHNVHKKIPRMVARSSDSRWTPPSFGLYKINFDGALFEEQACAGLGVVIRDSVGLLIGALSQKIWYQGSMDMVEALAASRAIIFAKELCLQSMVVEGDSLQVIQAILVARPSRTMFGLADIHSLVSDVNF